MLNFMKSQSHIVRNKQALLISCLLVSTFCQLSCDPKPDEKSTRETVDYIRPIPGVNDIIPVAVAQKGEVLISYSDCYTCHKEDQKSVGPAFRDIAKRYPANKDYVEMLAHKVIVGGRGSWGSPVMDPHPKLPIEDARLMVTYILSLKN
jgi:cytochrome c